MIKINKLAVIAICSLFSASIQAQEDSLNVESQKQEIPTIYAMKENDGSTILTNKTSKYSHLSILF